MGSFDNGRGLKARGVGSDIGDIVGGIDLVPDKWRQWLGHEDESAPGQDRHMHSGECSDLATPRAGGVDDVTRVDHALRGAHTGDRAFGVAIDADDLHIGHDTRTVLTSCRIEQVRCGEHGLHLHVLRIEHAASEVRRDMGLGLRQIASRDGLGNNAVRALTASELDEMVEGLLAGRDDETALGIELTGSTDLISESGPGSATMQCEIELGSGLLIGDEDVALARARGAPCDRSTVDHRDGQARSGARPGAARTDDAGTDDDDIRARDEIGPHVLSSCLLAQMPRT